MKGNEKEKKVQTDKILDKYWLERKEWKKNWWRKENKNNKTIIKELLGTMNAGNDGKKVKEAMKERKGKIKIRRKTKKKEWKEKKKGRVF